MASSPNRGKSTGDPQFIAPLLSYFSDALHSMLTTVECSQATSHNVIIKEISVIHNEIKVLSSPTEPNSRPDMEVDDSFPPAHKRSPMSQCNFVASDSSDSITYCA